MFLFIGYSSPQSSRTPHGSTIVTHKEFIQDIDGSSAFSILGFDVQPGLPVSFPWLSSLAGNFQQYRIKSCEYVFRSTSADSVSAATNLGSVMLVHESDPSAPAPVSKQDILTMAGVRDTKPSLSVKCPLDVNRRRTNAENTHYVRGPGGIPSGASKKEYDYGTFYIATQNCAQNTIGELWVVYTIELMRPQQNDDMLFRSVELIVGDPSLVTKTDPFGGAIVSQLETRGLTDVIGNTSAYRASGSAEYFTDSKVGSSPGEYLLKLNGSSFIIGRRYLTARS